VRIDTTLSWQTIPPGTVKSMQPTWSTPNLHGNTAPRPEYHFDFLNYGGLLRSVWLLNLPAQCIEALAIKPLADGDRPTGLCVTATLAGSTLDTPSYRLLDSSQTCVAAAGEGEALLPEAPQSWSPDSPYLYTLEITLGDADIYRIPVGLRTVRVTPSAFLLNGEAVYFKGCGLHEDFHLSGHGHSDTRLVKDLTLLKNMGANSFRTAHYPYDETAYQLADRLGLLVINETAAVGLNAWDAYQVFTDEHCNAATRAHHQRVLELMIRRDHVHPSVVMWSIANEPSCHEPGGDAYFAPLFEAARAIDPQKLPLTVVQSSTPPGRHYPSHHSRSAKYCDVILWNRYYAWYQDGGHPEDVALQVEHEAEAWREAFPEKPVMLAEFGADAIAGQHSEPAVMFSEEYQQEIIQQYCDQLDKLPYVIGEHVWNLCDFMTKQGLTRVIGNRKGIHTRERQPKMAAHYLKQRWLAKLD
jgi:beta-glucuronidase